MALQYEHPKELVPFQYVELQRLGMDEMTAGLMHQVYLDLSESKVWFNLQLHCCAELGSGLISGHQSLTSHREVVQLHCCAELGSGLISGHQSLTSHREVVLPMRSSALLSHADIRKHLQAAAKAMGTQSLIYAFVDEDSTIIYYRVGQTFIPPEPPELIDAKIRRRQRRHQRQRTRFLRYNEASGVQARAENPPGSSCSMQRSRSEVKPGGVPYEEDAACPTLPTFTANGELEGTSSATKMKDMRLQLGEDAEKNPTMEAASPPSHAMGENCGMVGSEAVTMDIMTSGSTDSDHTDKPFKVASDR